MPDLSFQVEGAEVVANAATPLLAFKLRLTDANPEQTIHTVALRCQIQLEVTRRKYTPEDQERLLDLFGEPSRWGQTLRNLLWTHANLVVPSFKGTTLVDLPVPCTFDFNVAATKYFDGLADGEVPVCLQFSGTVFYAGPKADLQVAPISWDKEARFKLPVKIWRDMMESYYPNSAWLCLHKDAFDRLYQYKVRARHSHLGRSAGEHHSGGRDGDLMNLAAVEQIAKAVLYEGYMLYPYRPSSVKNQQRWNFGVLCPQSYSEAQNGSEAWTMQTECLVEGSSMTGLEVRVRFLQLVARTVGELTTPVNELSPGEDAGVSPGGEACGGWPRLPALAGSGRARSHFAGVQRGSARLPTGARCFQFPCGKAIRISARRQRDRSLA